MGSDATYDFSNLRKKMDVVIVSMDQIIYGSGSLISIQGGKLNNVLSLTCYMGEVNIQKGSVKVDNLALISAPVSNKATVESTYFLIDSYSLSCLSQLSTKVDNFAVFLPEKSEWNLITFTNNNNLEVQPGNFPTINVPTKIGKKQTSIVTYATDVMLKSDSVKTIKDNVNISVHSFNDPVYVEFVGSEWTSTQLSNKLIVETDDINLVKVRGSPKKGKVVATERFDETKTYPKKKKLSNGAIAGIVVAILILIAVAVWVVIFLLCVKKDQEATTQDEKSMKTTNDLFKPIFQEDN